jgi:hypothetical protein
MGAEMMILPGKGRNYIIPSLDPLVTNKHARANRVGLVCASIAAKPLCSHYSLHPFWNLGKLVAGYPGFDRKGAITTGFRELKTDANC